MKNDIGLKKLINYSINRINKFTIHRAMIFLTLQGSSMIS